MSLGQVVPGFVRVGPRAAAVVAGAVRERPAVPRLLPTPMSLSGLVVDELAATFATFAFGWHEGHPAVRPTVDVRAAVERLGEIGALDDPRVLHPPPPPPDHVTVRVRRQHGLRFEELRLESGWEPPDGMPRRSEWLANAANRTSVAYVLRHRDDRPRPWLISTHGTGMGTPLDMRLMWSHALHTSLGINVVHPVAPVHGPRRGGLEGGRFPSLDVIANLYGFSQSLWDDRRLLAWIREQTTEPIGVHGFSLGGFRAALLASTEPDLACVIVGGSPVDFTRLAIRHLERQRGPRAALAELRGDAVQALGAALSLIGLDAVVDHDRRFIYGGVVDRFAEPNHTTELWRHWGEPKVLWVNHGHLGTMVSPQARRFVRRSLVRSGVTMCPPPAELAATPRE